MARARPRERSPGERAVREHAHALIDAERDHLALLLAVQEVVVILHRCEARPAVPLGGRLRLGELPRRHGAGAQIASLAGPDDIVQRLHRLLDRGFGIPAMHLVEVDVIHLETPERGVDRREHVLAREAATVGAGRRRIEDLGRDHHLVARDQSAQHPPGDDLARATRIHVGGVEERDAALERATHDRLRCPLVEHPGSSRRVAEAHHPERDPRDLQPARPQSQLIDLRAFPSRVDDPDSVTGHAVLGKSESKACAPASRRYAGVVCPHVTGPDGC